jgi:hypothetical protein
MRIGILVAAGLMATTVMAKESSWSQTWTSDSEHMDFAYGLVEQTETGGALNLSGTSDDRDALLRQREKTDGTFVWLRSGSKRYLVTDAATVARAKEILAPEIELSRNQSQLGEVQSRLGSTQSQLGVEQGRVGVRQAQIGQELARIARERVQPGTSAARQDELDREAAALAAEMDELGRAQDNLGSKQTRMGEDQSKLGDEQTRDAELRKGGLRDGAVPDEVLLRIVDRNGRRAPHLTGWRKRPHGPVTGGRSF